MSVTANDIKFRKSVMQTDTDVNGGRKGNSLVISGARHSLFPRVTKTQRENGLIRYRKQFYCNENESNLTAYGVLVYLMRPSNAEDHFYLAKGTQIDNQGDFKRKEDVDTYADSRYDRVWTGVGQLETALTGGENEVILSMESDDFQFPNGGYLYISDNTMAAQNIDEDVNIGDSVLFSGGSWSKISHTNDISYPNGWCVGIGEVLTMQEETNEEFLQIADNQYSDENIGSGDGTNTSPALSTLANVTDGVCRQPDKRPVVTATCGGTERTVNVDANGDCSGYCSAGKLNMDTGAWTTDITWTSAPDNTTDILITYHENAYSYTGNIVTIGLETQVANPYQVVNTFGCGCVHGDEVACVLGDMAITSSQGTYNEAEHPIQLYNKGTVYENWTFTFTSATNFGVSGSYYGSIGTGSISSDFSPINPETGEPYMVVPANGWGGTWANGDSITVTTAPSALPILLEEEVPAGTSQEPNNLLALGSYTE